MRASLAGTQLAAPKAARVAARRSVVARADFFGSSTNLIMVASTTACLAAGRFGLAPTANKPALGGNGLQLRDKSAGVGSADPAGFTVVDVFAMGSAGHVIGAGIILGLKALGN